MQFCSKYCSSDRKKNWKNSRLMAENLQKNWINRIIHSSSERSEQFLKKNNLSTRFWRLLLNINIETIKVSLGANNWNVET